MPPQPQDQPDELQKAETPRTDAFLEQCYDWQDKHWTDFARELERELQKMEKERDKLNRFHDSVMDNAPKCGACAEGLFCGSTMHAHDADCIYSERDQLKAALEKCAEALKCADNSFAGSPQGQRQIDEALSSPIVQSILNQQSEVTTQCHPQTKPNDI